MPRLLDGSCFDSSICNWFHISLRVGLGRSTWTAAESTCVNPYGPSNPRIRSDMASELLVSPATVLFPLDSLLIFFSYSPMYRATAGFILISLSISPTSTSTNCRLQPTVTKEYFSSVYNSVLSYLTSSLLLFQAQYIMYSAVHGPRHGSVSIGSPALNFIHPMHSIMIYYRCSKRTGRISNCSLGIKSVGQMNHNLGAQEETCWAAKRKIDHLHIIIQHHYVYAMFATPWKMHTNTITYGASVQLTYFLFMLLNVCVIKFVFQQLCLLCLHTVGQILTLLQSRTLVREPKRLWFSLVEINKAI